MIYKYPDLPTKLIKDIPKAKKPRGNPGRKKRPTYLNVVCAFDIETTALRKIKQSIMYIWQYQIGPEITIIGRTWDDFLALLGDLARIHPDVKYLTFVHNLSYEFVWLSGIWNFAPEDVFCTGPRQILRADMGPFEFRCSYRLTNMSLLQFTRQMKVRHRKLSGERYDYSKIRYPWTRLSDYELSYCVNDVVGLVEGIIQLMINEDVDFYSMPLTSTGFVRKDIKESMKTFNWVTMRRLLPPYSVHKKLKEAFRGGNTHANRHIVGQLMHDVQSYDMTSAYPSAQINKQFPMGKWYEADPKKLTLDYLNDLINRRHKAVLVEVAFSGIYLKDERWPVPYLSYDKCRHVLPYLDENGDSVSYDNGRILSARYLETTLTDIDLKIVLSEYKCQKMEIKYLAFSTYGRLPGQYREVVLDYFIKKNTLKGDKSQEWLYGKAKNRLNAVYGCSVMDPLQLAYIYDNDDQDLDIPFSLDTKVTLSMYEKIRDYLPASVRAEIERTLADDQCNINLVKYRDRMSKESYDKVNDIVNEDLYEKSCRYAYQSYAWGVWVTSYCRERLEAACRLVFDEGEKQKARGERIKTIFCYCDTDSVKFVGPCDFEQINKEYREETIKNGGFATDPKGNTHYLGVFEYEGMAADWITWGSKKYVYRMEKNQKIEKKTREYNGRTIEYTVGPELNTVAGAGDIWHITIAGVNKTEGARELERRGGVESLLAKEDGRPHFIFHDAGGTEAIYNDSPEVREYHVRGKKILITRNLYLEKHSYTLSITPSFLEIILHPDLWRKLLDARPAV